LSALSKGSDTYGQTTQNVKL